MVRWIKMAKRKITVVEKHTSGLMLRFDFLKVSLFNITHLLLIFCKKKINSIVAIEAPVKL